MKRIITPEDSGAIQEGDPIWTHCVVDTYHNEVRCYCESREECEEFISEQIRIDRDLGAPGMYIIDKL